jgi:hypothetical protein
MACIDIEFSRRPVGRPASVMATRALILSISARVSQGLRPQDPPNKRETYSLDYWKFN